jgi:uncharacterized phage protein gp47/JayE
MTVFGLTATGFRRKTLEDILFQIEQDELELIGPGLNTATETPIGQLNGIFAAKLSEGWELAEAVHKSMDPRDSTGDSLVGVSLITGTEKQAATKGEVTLGLTLNAGVTVLAGAVAHVTGDPTNRWVLTEDATNPGGAPAVITAEAEAETAGNIPALAGTIEVIATPVAGWTDVTNAASAEAGLDTDTDTQLRIRRTQELATAGKATLNAIRADLLDVEGVTSVTVLDNPTSITDQQGLPPHSVAAIVAGGTDQAVADALFATVAGGAQTTGSLSVTVLDLVGDPHTVIFSRPTVIQIWLEIDVDVDGDYPVTGDDLVAAAVKLFGDANYGNGDDVILSVLNSPIATVAGVVDITEIRVGIAPAPVSTLNYVIEPFEVAELDTTRILVTSTPV